MSYDVVDFFEVEDSLNPNAKTFQWQQELHAQTHSLHFCWQLVYWRVHLRNESYTFLFTVCDFMREYSFYTVGLVLLQSYCMAVALYFQWQRIYVRKVLVVLHTYGCFPFLPGCPPSRQITRKKTEGERGGESKSDRILIYADHYESGAHPLLQYTATFIITERL